MREVARFGDRLPVRYGRSGPETGGGIVERVGDSLLPVRRYRRSGLHEIGGEIAAVFNPTGELGQRRKCDRAKKAAATQQRATTKHCFGVHGTRNLTDAQWVLIKLDGTLLNTGYPGKFINTVAL